MPIKAVTLASVPTPCARFALEVASHIQKHLHIPQGSHFLLACSGGVDSTACAFLFALVQKRLDATLSAITINHGLRPEAEEEVAGTKAFLERLAIPCRVRTIAVKDYALAHAIGLEEAARTLRYQCLAHERTLLQADYIVIAHHADDLAEDVLMRLTRGCGWPALGGMRDYDEERHILRPLLPWNKAKLTALVQSLKQEWFFDQSNNDLRYTRNRFRTTILPLFHRENPHFPQTITHLSTMASYDRAFWDAHLTTLLHSLPCSFSFQPSLVQIHFPAAIQGLLPAERLRILRLCLTILGCVQKQWQLDSKQATASHLFALDHLITQAKGTKTLPLPGGICARVAKDGLTLQARRPTSSQG